MTWKCGSLDVQYREGVPDDLQRLLEIEKISFGRDSFSKRLVKALLLEESVLTLIAEEDGKAQAYGMIMVDRVAREGRVVSLAVVPSYRGKGFAKALLHAMEDHARKEGADRLVLEVGVVNVPAINLYLHDGFKLAGTVADYYGKGKDAFYLEKSL